MEEILLLTSVGFLVGGLMTSVAASGWEERA